MELEKIFETLINNQVFHRLQREPIRKTKGKKNKRFKKTVFVC